MKKSNNIFKYLLIVYTLLNIGFIFQIVSLGTLPMKYLLAVLFVLILIMLVLYLRISKAKGKNRISKFLLVLLSIGLVLANGYIYKYGSFLNKISGSSEKREVVSVIVKKDSKYNSLEDVKDLVFGLEDDNDELVFKAMEEFQIRLNYNLETKEYNSYKKLASALLDGTQEVIVINEAYRSFIRDEFDDFDETTKVIAEFKNVVTIEKPDINVSKDTFAVLISGIDVYGNIANNSRSDVNILAIVNPTTKDIMLVSIPRDYYLPMACQNNNLDKLTHSGIWGVDCTMKTLGKLFNIDIDYYLRVNFSSLINVVDAVGGVYVVNEHYFTAGGYTFPVSQKDGNGNYIADVYLDGQKSLVYVRDRYNQPDGDLARGRNQMKVMSAIINKMASPALITNFSSIMSTLSGTFQTNMGENDISALVKLQLNDMTSWNIKQMQVSGTGATDYSYALGTNAYVMYPDQSSVDAVKAAIKELGK